jgi:hypothetical protein
MRLADIITANPTDPQIIADMGDHLRLVLETPDGQRTEATAPRDEAGLARLKSVAWSAVAGWASAHGGKSKKSDVVAFCRSIGVDAEGTKSDILKALRGLTLGD